VAAERKNSAVMKKRKTGGTGISGYGGFLSILGISPEETAGTTR